MAKRDHQVSVPLPSDLREFVERVAEQEDRTIAGQIRHLGCAGSACAGGS